MATTSQPPRAQAAAPATRSGTLPEFWPVGTREWPLLVKPNARARRMSLRVVPHPQSAHGSAIQLTLPRRASLKAALVFLQASGVWLARELDRQVRPQILASGCALIVMDETLEFRHTGRLRGLPQRDNAVVWISGAPERFAARVAGYIQAEFAQHTQHMATAYAQQLGVSIRSIRLKEMRARWGSCSSSGDITLHWRLALAPLWVANYVIAHEIAHRQHMNHSADFWRVVRHLTPDTERARDWLNSHSKHLHSWQF